MPAVLRLENTMNHPSAFRVPCPPQGTGRPLAGTHCYHATTKGRQVMAAVLATDQAVLTKLTQCAQESLNAIHEVAVQRLTFCEID
jgi:hypothetical protein